MPSKFDPRKHHRRSIRLPEYDYSQPGAYYVTIVAWQRKSLFGDVVNKEMKLNRYGEIVQKWWGEIPNHFPGVETGAFIIMPNHVHGIIMITNNRRGTVLVPHNDLDPNNIESPEQNNVILKDDKTILQGGKTPPLHQPTLGQIVAYFKYQSTKEMNDLGAMNTITKFWQRNYYEHVIRDEKDLQNKTDYIEANPILWDEDHENPMKTT